MFVKKARQEGHVVLMLLEQFVEIIKVGHCHYCLRPLHLPQYRGGKENRRSRYCLDRMHNEPDYRADNAVLCCSSCNFTKKNLPYDHFWLMTEPYREGRLEPVGLADANRAKWLANLEGFRARWFAERAEMAELARSFVTH